MGALGRVGGGEEVDEQLRDALMLVVMDPVRRFGQALDAVEVGNIVVIGLGQFGAEVAIALPPDDESWKNCQWSARTWCSGSPGSWK